MGASYEKCADMYVRNIKCDDGLTHKDDVQLVTEHGKSNGFDIRYAKVITNKWQEDVMGCLIKIPGNQVNIA